MIVAAVALVFAAIKSINGSFESDQANLQHSPLVFASIVTMIADLKLALI